MADTTPCRQTDVPCREKSGGVGAGPMPSDPRRSGERRGRTGCEKGKEAEVPGGRGARAGSGEGRRGGGLRKNAPTSCPARARKREPGHRARDRRARPRAPRRSPPCADTRYTVCGPARPPPLGCSGKWEERGGWGAAGSGGASWGTPEPETAPPWASVFPSVKGGKENRTNTRRVSSR